MRSARTEAFWQAFRCHIGADDPKHQVTYFRTSPEVTEKLIAMIVAGAMRAVAGVMHYFGEGREEPLPTTGDYALLLDSRRRPRLIWRTTGVSVGPLSSVSTHHVWADGLGGGDRETWLAIHRRGFARQARMYRFEMHDDIETMFEEFEVVWPDSVARRLKLVVPQLERGFALHQRLDEQRAATEGLEAVLGRIQTAVLTIGPTMRLCFANPAAETLLRRGDGLRLREGHLIAKLPVDTQALATAVAGTTSRSAGTAASQTNNRGAGTVVFIRRGEECCPYRATVFPLCRGHAVRGLAPVAEAVVFIDDPDAAPMSSNMEQDLFRHAYGLTPAEARLAAYLASGNSLTNAADAFCVTRNTVRAQLRSTFDKTDVRRQADLVRLLQALRTLRISLP